jgi:hypothetical protein
MPSRRRIRIAIGVLLGGLAGLVAGSFAVTLMTGWSLGAPPEPAAVCARIVEGEMVVPPAGVAADEWCGEIDFHLDIPIAGPDGFEAAVAQPDPPSDPTDPRPDFLRWDTNGCSAPGIGGGPFTFDLACYRHDFGWRNLKQLDREGVEVWHVPNKDRVDAGFLYDMRVRCASVSPVFRIGCEATARIYYSAVRLNPSGVDIIPEVMAP